jgi:hypothetical protein
MMRYALALALTSLVACSAGKQTLGYASADAAVSEGDFSGDTFLPWYGGPAYHARWPNGISASASHVPIGVWMQQPLNAERYREAGINLFIGLWEGPTDEQLELLDAARDVTTFCSQAGVWQSRIEDAAISGWLIEESPDNAQELPEGGYGPCIEPEVMQAKYDDMTAADATRPVMLLLGQGVADADWPGRGECDGRDDQYPGYAEAADVLGFYYYPVSRARPLELFASGVERLLDASRHRKPILAMIEAASVVEGVTRPTPDQMRAAAWIALVSGAAGIAYYCHDFEPELNETDCLDHAPTRAAMQRINAEIAQLAPALNSPTVSNGVTVESAAPIATRLTRIAGTTYLFAAALSNEPTEARFELRAVGHASAEVIGEARDISIEAGTLEDDFEGYAVHLYRLAL